MTALVAPRSELPLIDPRTGLISREWFRYLVQLGRSVGNSPTLEDDLNLQVAGEAAAIDGTALSALALAKTAEADAQTAQSMANDAKLLALFQEERAVPQDMSLLGWWPGESK